MAGLAQMERRDCTRLEALVASKSAPRATSPTDKLPRDDSWPRRGHKSFSPPRNRLAIPERTENLPGDGILPLDVLAPGDRGRILPSVGPGGVTRTRSWRPTFSKRRGEGAHVSRLTFSSLAFAPTSFFSQPVFPPTSRPCENG
jgi:hypothetical protein